MAAHMAAHMAAQIAEELAMETATEVADEMAAQVATQMAATVTQPSRRVRHDVTESAMGANGNTPRSLEHALPTGSSATRADGVCRSCDVRGRTRNRSPSCDVQISASQPNATRTRTRTPAARASSQHSSRTAAAQPPRHSCRVAGLWPDLSRKRAGTQPEVSWNSAKR